MVTKVRSWKPEAGFVEGMLKRVQRKLSCPDNRRSFAARIIGFKIDTFWSKDCLLRQRYRYPLRMTGSGRLPGEWLTAKASQTVILSEKNGALFRTKKDVRDGSR